MISDCDKKKEYTQSWMWKYINIAPQNWKRNSREWCCVSILIQWVCAPPSHECKMCVLSSPWLWGRGEQHFPAGFCRSTESHTASSAPPPGKSQPLPRAAPRGMEKDSHSQNRSLTPKHFGRQVTITVRMKYVDRISWLTSSRSGRGALRHSLPPQYK